MSSRIMWDIKQKVTNKQPLIYTNNRRVVTREEGLGKNKESKGGQIYSNRRLDFGW